MKRALIFVTILYILSAAGGGYLYLKNKVSNELEVKKVIITLKADLSAEQAKTAGLEQKITSSGINAKFLALALCPTLQATDENALCVKDNTEWFSQTIIAGTMITDADTKSKMATLLVSLGAKTKPTSKQLYEMLKPIEASSLKVLSENLK